MTDRIKTPQERQADIDAAMGHSLQSVLSQARREFRSVPQVIYPEVCGSWPDNIKHAVTRDVLVRAAEILAKEIEAAGWGSVHVHASTPWLRRPRLVIERDDGPRPP